MGISKLLELAVKQSASSAARSVTDNVTNRAQRSVNWEDYNYPPYFRIVHYDNGDLEVPGQRSAVTWAHWSYIATLAALILNILGNLVLAFGGVKDKGVHVVYAFFNLIIVGVVGMYGFYHGYKGLATGNSKMTSRYLLVVIAIFFFMFISSLLGVSNFNGWLNINRAKDADSMSEFWIGWTIFESCLWSLNMVGMAVVFYMVYTTSDHTPNFMPI
mmetsp:Transcript_29970/g.41501  ORF Transcript_29970/g.41501 Transcript_29970/m.41501 type:complete len:216 (-) Transcript_29970:337-984(-)